MMEAAGPWPAEIDMGVTEIVLIILGIAVFAASFLVPDKYAKQEDGIIKEQEKKLKLFLQRELQTIRIGIEEKVEESMVSCGEKSERYMERITNEKIMAIQEYSDTVLDQIHKNHEEAVFLYDMLNNKHDQIKYTAGEISSAVEEARQKLEITVQDVTRDLLRGSIRDSLIEKIGNMLQETVQEAIDTSIKEDLQDRIEKTVQKEVELAVSENLMRAIKEAVEISIEESIREREQKGPLISGIEVLANKQQEKEEKGDLTERKKEDSKDTAEKLVTEAGEQEFQELALGIPEVIMEEEQPFVVQPVKKVSPKKKAPAKKGGARAKTTINSEGNKDIPAGKEEAGSNNKEKILKLHREGMSNMAIARELGLGIGEVQLVIGLFEGM